MSFLLFFCMCGIIPACAGSTSVPIIGPPPIRDHPRMCGEHAMAVQGKPIRPGSSPHVRGALTQCVVRHDFLGIIPACAGSTNMVDSWYDQVRDHPRMCGEHATITR